MTNIRAIDKVTTAMKLIEMRAAIRRLAWMLMLSLSLTAAAADQRRFATPEAALDAVIVALKANDDRALIAIFGEKHKDLVISGDPAYDAANRKSSAADLDAFRAFEEQGPDRRIVLVGPRAWPFPIPLVREAGTWRFATELGAEEILNRRVGMNERNAISVLRAYLDAQREYASRDRNGDGVLEYAQKVMSTPGKRDGLFWNSDANKVEDLSPFGPLVAEASPYLAGHKTGDPYRGYYIRILTRQGKNAAGGPYSYVINGRMIAGFAMLAYPARYGETGVMTFIVNHNGKLYEKDLGQNTARLGAAMIEFDPGPGWKEVAP